MLLQVERKGPFAPLKAPVIETLLRPKTILDEPPSASPRLACGGDLAKEDPVLVQVGNTELQVFASHWDCDRKSEFWKRFFRDFFDFFHEY